MYKLASEKVEASVIMLADMLNNPQDKANADTLKNISVIFDEFIPAKEFTPIEENRIKTKLFEDIGDVLNYLKKSGEFNKMLQWQKTYNLIPIVLKMGDTSVRTDVRLALRENEEGKLHLAIHTVNTKTKLRSPLYGDRIYRRR